MCEAQQHQFAQPDRPRTVWPSPLEVRDVCLSSDWGCPPKFEDHVDPFEVVIPDEKYSLNKNLVCKINYSFVKPEEESSVAMGNPAPNHM